MTQFSLKSRVVMAIAVFAIIALVGGIYLSNSNPAQAVTNNPNTTVLASVWDQSTESYSGNQNITVYRSPSCGCCGVWIEHMKKNGFHITDIKTDEMDAIKKKHHVPQTLTSCHTAIIDDYVVEGHVPADDIKRFLKQKPQFAGLTVPGMPLGTPGMDAEDKKQPFEVIAFNKTGEIDVFNRYERY